ncbi:hypothetical protein FRX31_006097 [Thalictrum thalictroides]|uniref:Uncharacterized protein n=1 Tax=Thalictrum thalictroides TaxID=46969 RepID=A0A7J6X3I3_THATH|nr:hypothetical protein FRX31_006097 [Thalictrum thalictroides]
MCYDIKCLEGFQEAIKCLEALTVDPNDTGLEPRRKSVLEFLYSQLTEVECSSYISPENLASVPDPGAMAVATYNRICSQVMDKCEDQSATLRKQDISKSRPLILCKSEDYWAADQGMQIILDHFFFYCNNTIISSQLMEGTFLTSMSSELLKYAERFIPQAIIPFGNQGTTNVYALNELLKKSADLMALGIRVSPFCDLKKQSYCTRTCSGIIAISCYL